MCVNALLNPANFPPQIHVSQEVPGIPPNFIPVISSGTAVSFYVTVSDANGDNFTTSFSTFPHDLLSTNMNVDNGFGNYSFSWSIGDPADLQISIISTDDDNATSQVQLQVSKTNHYTTFSPFPLSLCHSLSFLFTFL